MVNCCLNVGDPKTFVSIGYYTDQINPGDTLGLTVENADESCGGENYTWLITAGGGSLSAETGLDVIYTAPADGANCPGNTTITLYCGGEVVDTLVITINYDYAIEWDTETSAETIGQSDSVAIAVIANNTPLTWSVSGTGFSLEHAETAGVGNILHAGAGACGPATIICTGCDGQSVTGYVRCTTGQWVIIEKLSEGDSACMGVGAPFWLYGTWWAGIGGKYKVEEYMELTHTHGYSPNNLCPGECTPYCEELHPCETCLGVTCAQLGPITPLGNFPCCYNIYPEYDPSYRYYTDCHRVYERILYEWKC